MFKKYYLLRLIVHCLVFIVFYLTLLRQGFLALKKATKCMIITCQDRSC